MKTEKLPYALLVAREKFYWYIHPINSFTINPISKYRKYYATYTLRHSALRPTPYR